MNTVYAEFCEPGPMYRAKPFWAWNGDLHEDEIRRQIRIFKEMGYGGYFMHSRVGLKTRYLGDKWFKMIKAGIDEGKKNGMEAWLYDEDRWPSGLAGGLVTKNPRWRNRRLNCIQTSGGYLSSNLLAVFRYALDDKGCLTTYERVDPSDLAANEKALAFEVVEGHFDPFYNGYTYLDTLNKDAVRAFIDSTYELYYQHCGDEFGKTIPGIFTDEPNRGHFLGKWKESENEYQIPWTDTFPEEFKTRMGYDILSRLPEVFYNKDEEKYSKTRADVVECINQLFVEAFAVQIGRWCEEHNLILTGHILSENSLGNQLSTSGSMARFYEHMQAPGMDILRQKVVYSVPKQVQSVARQLGKKWVLSEMYAGHGWEYSLEGLKTYGDWQAVLGVNLRCPHLSWYTMAGECKRDCPPSISFQQTWWHEYKYVEDYFARVNLILSQGDPVCDLLFIHPIESVGGMAKPGWVRRLEEIDEGMIKVNAAFQSLANWLLSIQVDFDYGDEEMLARMARIEDTAEGPTIILGKMRYRRVILSSRPNMRASTLELLSDFAGKGGEVVWVGDPPTHVDWETSDKPGNLASTTISLPFDESSLVSRYRTHRPVAILNDRGNDVPCVFSHFRENEQAAWLFLANVDCERSIENVEVHVEAKGQVQEWDPFTAKKTVVPSQTDRNTTIFQTNLVPGGSRIFVIASTPDPSIPKQQYTQETKRIVCSDTQFPVTLDEPNVVVLDIPRYRIGEKPLQDATHILEIDKLVRRELNLDLRDRRMIQPWFRAAFMKKNEASLPLTLVYEFEINQMPQQDIEIALEQPEKYRLSVNGHPISFERDNGWWIDPCLQRFVLKWSLLVTGKNTITVETDFEETLDLEAIYLLGDFGVKINGTRIMIEKPVRMLSLEDWTAQGLPFYSGSVRYKISFPDIPKTASHLVVPAFRGGCIRVYLDNRQAGTLLWRPYEIELPPNVSFEAIQIEVVGHRGNSIGATLEKDNAGYRLHELGLMESPYLSCRV